MRFHNTIWTIPLLFACCAVPLNGQENEPEYSQAVLIRLEGMISPLLEQYMYRKLDLARDNGADLVIFEIDSPGGFVHTTLQMAERIRGCDWARTVAYIPREAISGAAIISLACDDLLVAPDARLGDAGQIMMGEDNMFRYVPEKERSYLVRHVRDLAEATGRPPALAEAMVDMELTVYSVTNRETGEVTFMSAEEIESAENPEVWERGQPVLESRKDHFLTVKGERAIELQLAQGLCDSREALEKRYAVGGKLQVIERSSVDIAVIVLNWPIVTGLLFVIGLIAAYIEFSAPGISIGGLIAGLCFSLFFWSRFLGGTAGWLEVILFMAGVVFVLMELFVIPGFGISGISGVLLITVSVLMASQDFFIPSSSQQFNTTLSSFAVFVTSGVVFLGGAALLSHYLGSIPVLSWLALDVPRPDENQSDLVAGAKPLTASSSQPVQVQVGDWGIADSQLRPAGKAKFGDDFVDVVTDGTFVDPGCQVRVIEVSGNRIVVREIQERQE